MYYEGGFFGLLTPFALLSGLTSIAMLLLHGAAYAALETDESIALRARPVVRAAAMAFLALYLAAGAWLAFRLPGYAIVSAPVPDGPSNPMLKQVAMQGHWFASFAAHPALWLAPLLALAAASGAIAFSLRRSANSMANTLNLSGAMGASIRLMGLSSQKVPLSRAAALIGMQALSLLSGLSLLVIVTLASTSSLPMSSGTPALDRSGRARARRALSALVLFPDDAATADALAPCRPRHAAAAPEDRADAGLVRRLAAGRGDAVCVHLSIRRARQARFAARRVRRRRSAWPGQPGARRTRCLRRLDPAGAHRSGLRQGLRIFRPDAVPYHLLPVAAVRRTVPGLGNADPAPAAAAPSAWTPRRAPVVRCARIAVCHAR